MITIAESVDQLSDRLKAEVEFSIKNLIPVTIGNTIGGVAFVGLGLWGGT